ncbi:retrovirus-related pol polyprotein from transposon TNT 1-94 [Tanacetum coccineum]
MSSNSDDIQATGSDTYPPMLDRTDYESWSQRIRLYCRGKENGLQILQSIDQGPFELGTTRNTPRTTPEGGVLLGPERPRTYEDLSSELTKEDRESQLYDKFERFKMLPVGNGGAHNRAGNSNAGQRKSVKCYNCNGVGHITRNCTQPKRPQNSDYFKDKMLLMQAQENGAVLDEEELLFLAGEQGNTFDAYECDAFDLDVDNELTAQSIFMANLSLVGSANPQAGLSNASILSEVTIYEQRAKFKLTEHEQRMDDQMRMLIQNRNKTEENLKKELHSVKLQLNLTMENNKILEETVTTLKQEFKQKESKFLTDFSNLKHLNDKLENKLHLQDQSIQTVHMIQTKKAQPTLYDGDELLKPHYVPVIVPSSEEELELAEATRNKLHVKMNDSAYVEKRVNAKELKANATPLPVLPPMTVYPPNTLVHLVPRTLPTTSQVNIGLYVITQLFWDFEKTCKKRITPTGITEGERGFEQTKRCYLTKVNPFFNLLKEHCEGNQKSLVTEVRAMKAVFENLEAEVDQKETDLRSGEIEQKNRLITNENLVAECLSKDVFYTATDSVLNVSRFFGMHDAFTSAHKCIADLESENFNLINKIQNDDHGLMIKHLSKLEVEHFNLQLKYQNLKERFGNKKPVTSLDAPSFDSLFVIRKQNEQIQSRGNTIHELKEKISYLTKKNSDTYPTFDLKALVSQNKDLTAKPNALYDLNKCFRAENAKVKQHYKELYDSIKITRTKTTDQNNSLLSEIKHLKAQLKENSKCFTIPDCKPKVLAPETLREIVEDAKVERPLDTSLASTFRYTKHSQELLEYVIGTCPKDFGPRDKQNASTNSLRKKEVTFVEPCETLTHNTPPQVEHQKINLTNIPGIPSIGVKGASVASRSKPRSNTKKDRTLPAKSALKQVEAHSRMNKSNEKHKNHVDSSISYKRTIINSNSNTFCKTCNKCLISVNHDQCVVRSEMCVKQSSATKVVQIVLWYLDSGCSKYMTGDHSRLRNFMKKFIGIVRFGNDHFGEIMGYGDYVIGDSVISMVYYVEGLGYNLFSVGQFCDSDLEVAFRKHTCFVRDLDGVDLIKGSHGTNLYTIFVDDMMRSSLIFLLSKASKNKSWLWHHWLNHLNFGTLNDLARKDLVRGLPRLKFEKDDLCSACQLGKSRKATHKPNMINTIIEVLHTLHMDLCGPMRVQSINGKKYILVIVDDYSIFTWVKFLRSKDETLAFNNFKSVSTKLSVPRTPQQNGVVERRNRTLVKAARTMLIFSKAPLFLWAEAVATACYTQNRSLIHTLHNKNPY